MPGDSECSLVGPLPVQKDKDGVMSGDVLRGRELFGRRSWSQAFDEFLVAEASCGLDVADVERLAICAYLIGRSDESAGAWERACLAHVRRDDTVDAARCAFWAAFVLLNRGELARGSGWVHRGQRLLLDSDIDCVELGYLGYADSLRRVVEGDVDGAVAGFSEATVIGDRFSCTELAALGRVGQGRCLIASGETAAGMALLDEALSVISAAEVSPTVIGDVYCTAIEGCQEVFDVRRAREWTAALTRWCSSQPELVLYQGQCLVHRAELLLFGGMWSQAVAEAQRACDVLSRPRNHPALGSAYYVRAELHRVRGEFPEAEKSYQRASEWGREPQPGLAQLWLDQGKVGAAVSAIRQAVAGTEEDPVARATLLGPLVEISLAAGDVAAARQAADELADFAVPNLPVVTAMAAYANGAVLIGEGQPRSSLPVLRRAWTSWTELGAPYQAARARVAIGMAQRALGNEQGAARELAAARSELERLGVHSIALGFLNQTASDAGGAEHRLTSREAQVLRLLATGVSNKKISARLFISEKTTATHVSNILRKLGVRSRSAATAYAHDRHLL